MNTLYAEYSWSGLWVRFTLSGIKGLGLLEMFMVFKDTLWLTYHHCLSCLDVNMAHLCSTLDIGARTNARGGRINTKILILLILCCHFED